MRGSRDGFNFDEFRKRCIEKGPILIVMKSDYNEIFGCITSASWPDLNEKGGENYIRNKRSIVFSVTQKSKHIPY